VRKNQSPAKRQGKVNWWLPGGRVWHKEKTQRRGPKKAILSRYLYLKKVGVGKYNYPKGF
jgi:hypothetical protein